MQNVKVKVLLNQINIECVKLMHPQPLDKPANLREELVRSIATGVMRLKYMDEHS